jgi:hypothetical protein
VQRSSIAALHDIVSSDQAALDALLDKDAARSRPEQADPTAQVNDAQPILTFGNSQIAFVLLAAVASGDSFYGMRHMIMIHVKRGSEWRILYLDPDAKMPDVEGLQGIDANPQLLRTFDSRIVSNRPEPPPPAAALIDPPDRAVFPMRTKPDIVWESSASADASFVVEAQFTNPGDEVNWTVSVLTFVELASTAHPFRQQSPFGASLNPVRWRIWTLGQSGAVSVSPWRLFYGKW